LVNQIVGLNDKEPLKIITTRKKEKQMAFNVQIDVDKTLVFNAPADVVFKQLANVPETADLFPKLASIEQVEDKTFQWKIKEIGQGGYSFSAIYSNLYNMDKTNGVISWASVESSAASASKENTTIDGSWEITDNNGESSVRFQSKIVVHLPFSKMVKMVVKPFVQLEFDRLVERYLGNIQNHFVSERESVITLGLSH